METLRGDMTEEDTREEIGRAASGGVDVVISDMAPNMTGEYNLDHARSVHLARTALDTAQDILNDGGHFVAKVFDGQDFQDFKADVDEAFAFSRTYTPDASRDSSSELYVVGKNLVDAPIEAGDAVEVDIVGVGDEGDGIAKVADGFTLFVPDTEEGETVDVEITDVKPNFGFAERQD